MPIAKSKRLLKQISTTIKGLVRGWVVSGFVLGVTGFAPPEWIARFVHYVARPDDVHRLLPLALNLRVMLVLAGVTIVVADALYRSRRQTIVFSESTLEHQTDAPEETQVLPLPHKPSIAVLPFENLGDPEQAYFADGIAEDIITALLRFRWFFVIARNSSFIYRDKSIGAKQIAQELGVRYILQGSVRRSVDRVRISVQLIDASTGAHIWAERFDRVQSDIFEVQHEITERVTGAIEPELLRTEGEAAITRTGNLDAWNLVRQGTWYFHQFTRETHLRARALFRCAIHLDPQLAEAHVWLARVNGGLVAYGWSVAPEMDLHEGMKAGVEAVRLDQRSPYSHFALAIVSVFAGELSQAARAAEAAIELGPSFALGHMVLGTARLFSGDASAAIEPLEYGIRLSPRDPQNFNWLQMLALALFFSGQREAALNAALRALKIRPAWQPTLEKAVLCSMALGRIEEVRTLVEQMRHVDKPAVDMFAQLKVHNPKWAEEMSSVLREAVLLAERSAALPSTGAYAKPGGTASRSS